MNYIGRPIRLGFTDAVVMKAVKERLNVALVVTGKAATRLDTNVPTFDKDTQVAVKLFQTRHVDDNGQPLKQDGVIGALTWAVLFGSDSVPNVATTTNALLARVLQVAAGEEARHVREVPPNSNAGPDVKAYLASTRQPEGKPWCCAFVYWCFEKAAASLGTVNPMFRTAGCLDHWNHAEAKGARRITTRRAVNNPGLVTPGMIFIIDHGQGNGHTGLVEKVTGGLITTIEGNTDASRTREGGGVYRLTRKIGDINIGFIDYA